MYLAYDADTGRELAVKQVEVQPENPDATKVSACVCHFLLKVKCGAALLELRLAISRSTF